ncbi:hypothetical protein EDB95_5479 [Dinghuibacter silviterrae]|uniref:Uncharacterized protein n=1 Tax=Dinghuibacter silviterrae TaxID=1539049 RepID=A0A4R8DJC4_9BACT|nr:hypothetical protein EDB95_5479 [Dinghuibacter silviterrae]
MIFVNNVKNAVYVNATAKFNSKGFTTYWIEVGDSVMKQAGSKEITFRRGDSSIAFALDCDQ